MSVTAKQIMTHWPAMVGTVRNMLPRASHTVWEDIAGDAVEKALRNAHRFEDRNGRGPYSWLTTIAVRLTIDYMRTIRYRTVSLEEWSAATTDAGSARQVAHLDLHDAVADLPPYLTEFVALRLNGVDARAAGRQIGLRSQKASWTREQHARALLRPKLVTR